VNYHHYDLLIRFCGSKVLLKVLDRHFNARFLKNKKKRKKTRFFISMVISTPTNQFSNFFTHAII